MTQSDALIKLFNKPPFIHPDTGRTYAHILRCPTRDRDNIIRPAPAILVAAAAALDFAADILEVGREAL